MTVISGPSRTPSDRRRRGILRFLVGSATLSQDVITQVAEKLAVGERTIRLDLECLREEIEGTSIDELPRDLLSAIQQASSFRLLKTLGERVMVEMVQGTITRELGQALTDALREQRHTLRAMREEQGHAALKALEVLTPQEYDALKAFRESLIPKPLKPGEFPPPPSSDQGPNDPDLNDPEAGPTGSPVKSPDAPTSEGGVGAPVPGERDRSEGEEEAP